MFKIVEKKMDKLRGICNTGTLLKCYRVVFLSYIVE